jgi:hypothetical protein
VIGDSTMLLAAPALASEGFAVDARGCRQFFQALEMPQSLRDARALPDLVVMAGARTHGRVAVTGLGARQRGARRLVCAGRGCT